jgi:hypothetical protein
MSTATSALPLPRIPPINYGNLGCTLAAVPRVGRKYRPQPRLKALRAPMKLHLSLKTVPAPGLPAPVEAGARRGE